MEHLTMRLSTTGRRRYQAGFSLLEILAALAIMAVLWAGFGPVLSDYAATPFVNAAGTQLDLVSDAAHRYIKDNNAALTASLPLNGSSGTISFATLQSNGYLSSAVKPNNPYGQQYVIRIRYVTEGSGANTRNVIEPLVQTTGGQVIPDKELYRIASRVAAGGVISSADSTVATGIQGGWGPVSLSTFGGSPGAGHLAVALFYRDAATPADYLYRSAVPGAPELNRMNTAIDMGGNNINNAGAITASGTISTSTDVVAGRNMSAGGSMMVGGNMSVGVGLSVGGGGLSVAGNGTVAGAFTALGRLTANEYVQINGVAGEGGGCGPNGLVAQNGVGVILSCQSGVWKRLGTDPVYWGPVETGGSSSGTRNLALGSHKACFLTGQQSPRDANASCSVVGSPAAGFTLTETLLSGGTDHWCDAACVD
ncbi:shufflon system plasmid conjugative transfer pilus tip adhesin PilV [Achromobacter aloeverae]